MQIGRRAWSIFRASLQAVIMLLACGLFIAFVLGEVYALVKIHQGLSHGICGRTWCHKSWSGFLVFMITLGSFFAMAGLSIVVGGFLVTYMRFFPEDTPDREVASDDARSARRDDAPHSH